MKDKKKVIVVLLMGLIFLMVILIGTMIYWRVIILQQMSTDTQTYHAYASHYVLIADKGNSTFWDHVYEGAKSAGDECDAYIEKMGEGLAVNYSKEEMMEIAIYAGVDGILLEGDESESQREMINKATKAGIPVITMLNDNYGSRRISFVGVGNYDIGRDYAREVIKVATKDTKNVLFLGDSTYEGNGWNLIMNGFLDTIQNEGNHLELSTSLATLNSDDPFEIQETLREIFLGESVPDIVVCLNEVNTVNAYQAVVDYNIVGQVKIIGYYMSSSIQNAIKKQVITSSVVLDANEIGRLSVEALNEYQTTGYVSDYITIEAEVANKNNIEEYNENE